VSFDGLLRHRATIVRNVAVLDAGEPTYNSLGHPITQPVELAQEWPCLVQPRRAMEVAALTEAGIATSDHVGFGRPIDLRASDRLVLADGREFEVTGLPEDGGGQGRHLEVPLRRIRSEEPPEPEPS
jgi:hypothetical protein